MTSACTNDPPPDPPDVVPPDSFGRCADFDENRQVLWGDLHVHTELSFDANLQGTRTTQADAYAFARGQPIGLQPYTANGEATRTVQIDRPLDFVMVSDHAEFLSTLSLCADESSPAADEPQCIDYREALTFDADPADVNATFVQINGLLLAAPDAVSYPTLCGPDNERCLTAGLDVWRDVVREADAAYDRSDRCSFTTFPGYEWTGNPGARNLHRNVMFKNGNVPPRAYGYFAEPTPEGLWRRLSNECLETSSDCDVLTIPHNGNLSQGIFFDRVGGEPIDAEYAAMRGRMEPIIEIYQHKGASECLPGEPSSDELCGFESLPFSNLASVNLEFVNDPSPGGFLRPALGRGLELSAAGLENPFAYGITAATDTHISASGLVAEEGFVGHGGAGQANRFLPAPDGFPDIEYLSPGGLTAVWAEENAREAIFRAVKRKETFGTSGTRIVVRFFGGWDYPLDACDRADLVEVGYAQGVPMGADLTARPAVADAPLSRAPRFIVSARQDAQSAPLQRIQIVKGWFDGTEYRVEVFDVAGDPDNGADVDLETWAPRGVGASDLCTVWQDPSFESSAHAFYYARVIENPTCRWTTHQCVAADYDCDTPTRPIDVDCCDPVVGLNVEVCATVDCAAESGERCCAPPIEATIQERAWSSPIWFEP